MGTGLRGALMGTGHYGVVRSDEDSGWPAECYGLD